MDQCTDQYLFGYVNLAQVIDVCINGYDSFSCTNDNATLTKYNTTINQDCQDVISKITYKEIKCGQIIGAGYYNQSITHCSSANLYASWSMNINFNN